MGKERLQKILASAGIASRRRAEELIASGKVTVNGEVAALGSTVDPLADKIEVNGVPVVTRAGSIYLALNKPRGYVSSLRSTHGERTVIELVRVPARVFPVGRLDKETTGLILLTNDGDWANCVTHPRYGIEKEYAVLVRGHPGEDVLARLREGVELPDGTRTAPAQVWQMGGTASETWLRLVVIEGKKRQIRLMLVAVGHPVIALRRVRVGRIELGQLGEGRWRYLTEQEVESVRDAGPGKHSGAGA